MSDPAVSRGALRKHVEKWLLVQPGQRVALAFVDPVRYPGHIALAALEQELLAAAYGSGEPGVAMRKLDWWAEELTDAVNSGGHHPLTRTLFADARARRLPGELWLAPVLGAMAQFEQGTAVDFSSQLTAAQALHGSLARLETTWWFGVNARPDRAIRVAVLVHVLHALRRLQDDVWRDCLPLPMARLACFGLNRQQLGKPGQARDQAIRAQLSDVRLAWREVEHSAGPLSVFRGLESSLAEKRLRCAVRAGDPLSVLQRGDGPGGFGAALTAWRLARRWHRFNGD